MKKFRDHDIEVIMGTLLRVGVMISASIVVAGGIYYLAEHGQSVPHYETFEGEPSFLKSVKEILHGVGQMHSRAIIQMGLLVLIATPIARVIFSVIGFLLEKDYLYVVITLIVLGIISFSLFSGLVG